MAAKPSDEGLSDLGRVLGLGPEVTDSAIKLLLSTKRGAEILKHIQSQGQRGLGNEIESFVGAGAHGLEEAKGTKVIEKLFGEKPTAPAKPKEAKPKPLPTPQAAASSAPESPFTQLANALASEYLGQVEQLMPLTSGSGLFGPQGATTSLTNQAAASGIGGPAGSWLQGLASQEQSDASKGFQLGGQNVPGLQGSMNQVGEAAAKGALGMSGAIANMGPAEAQTLEAAPWQQILSELASETAYKAASTQGAAAFGLTPQNTPAFLQQILQSHGLAGTSATGSSGLSAPGTAAKGGSGSTSSGLSSTPSQTG